MKIGTGIILLILLLISPFISATEENENLADTTSPYSGNHSSFGCSPQPECDSEVHSSAVQKWVNKLFMRELLNQLKTEQEQTIEANDTPNE